MASPILTTQTRTQRPASPGQAAAITALYRQLDPANPDPQLCDALATAATEPLEPDGPGVA